MTLSYLCLNGDARGVYFGEALSRSLGATFRKLVGQEANDILGAFALGGSRGMSPPTVADALGVPLLQLRASLIRLAAGGVLREDREGRLSVWPAALRYVLVRDTFFGGKCDLPADALMAAASDKAGMAETLVGAIGRGAKIPGVLDILEAVGSPLAWREYASLGEEESKFVLQRHPEMLRTVGQVTLRLAPVKTLPLLFRAAVGDERNLGNAVDHPLRWVEDWISEAFPGKGQAVRRRKILAAAARRWLEDEDDERVGLRAAFLALNPAFRSGTSDPGSGMKYTLTSGLLANDELLQVREVWSEVRDLLSRAGEPHWERLFSAITPWVYPAHGSIREVPREVVRLMHSVAAEMIRDIAELSRDHPGVQQWVRGMADKVHADVETVEYRDFEALFPDLHREDWQEEEKRQMLAVSSLAQEWATRPPAEVAARLAQLEREAALVGKGWPRYTDALCRIIADAVTDPNPWLRELLDKGIAGDTAEPFLRKVAAARSPGWESAIERCFDSQTYERLAVYMVLTLDGVPEGLVNRALVVLQRHSDMAELLCLRDQVPEPTLRIMLRHESPAVSTAAAVGVWCSTPRGEIRESIRDDWRAAILKAEGVEHWLPEILKSDKSLAYDWLVERVGRDSVYFSYHIMEEMKAAISVLDFGQRAAVLQRLRGDGYADSELISELAGDDLRMYAEILKHRNLAKYHLSPLHGHPVGSWADKAILAFDAGYLPEEVVEASFDYGETWTGNTSDRWQRWAEEFEALTDHDDPRVREAAGIGSARARENRAEELLRERQEAVYGR